jgi:hypothetical protein
MRTLGYQCVHFHPAVFFNTSVVMRKSKERQLSFYFIKFGIKRDNVYMLEYTPIVSQSSQSVVVNCRPKNGNVPKEKRGGWIRNPRYVRPSHENLRFWLDTK